MKNPRIIKLKEYPHYYGVQSGSETFILRDLPFITDRENVCLKVFFKPVGEGGIENYYWGRPFPIMTNTGERYEYSSFLDAIRIQNIAAKHGLAPRIFEMMFLEIEGNKYPALLTEYVDKPIGQGDDPTQKILELGEKYGFSSKFQDDNNKFKSGSNYPGGLLVDFEGFYFDDDYEEKLKSRFTDKAIWADKTYQSVPELGIEAWRDEEKRIRLITQSKIISSFKDKVVWDIGCSGGFYSRLAENRQFEGFGAKRVFGIDYPSVIDGAWEMSNYLGYFNVDFIGRELKRGEDITDLPDPDIIFYLSVNRYFGYAPYLKRAKMVIYEHNGDHPDTETIAKFRADGFKETILGNSSEHDQRRLIIFERKS